MFCSATLKKLALELGFSAVGVARAEAVEAAHAARFGEWLAAGHHGEMGYLADNVAKRLDPRLLVEGAKSVVCVAMSYYPGHDYPPKKKDATMETEKTDDETDNFYLARYALGSDYHEVVKARLRLLMQRMNMAELPTRPGAAAGDDAPAGDAPRPAGMARAFVDTAPVYEKYWAERAGLGWCGRHSQLIIPGAGSYFFLGEIVTTEAADRYDAPMAARCGTCHACVEACPAGALLGNGTLDARRCLSYLTIERRGDLPAGTGAKMGRCFYGCDRCAEVCPHNRQATATQVAALLPREALLAMTRADWEGLSVEKYRSLFKGSAVKRAKFEGLKRNIAAVAGTDAARLATARPRGNRPETAAGDDAAGA